MIRARLKRKDSNHISIFKFVRKRFFSFKFNFAVTLGISSNHDDNGDKNVTNLFAYWSLNKRKQSRHGGLFAFSFVINQGENSSNRRLHFFCSDIHSALDAFNQLSWRLAKVLSVFFFLLALSVTPGARGHFVHDATFSRVTRPLAKFAQNVFVAFIWLHCYKEQNLRHPG